MIKIFLAFIACLIICLTSAQNPLETHANDEKFRQNNLISSRNQKNAGGTSIKLIEDPKCADDLKRVCGDDVYSLNNFAVLECIQNRERDDSALLSEDCHHVLWSHKYELTHSSQIEGLAKSYCKEDLNTISECSINSNAYGNTVSCLIQNMDKLVEEKCRQYIIRLGAIVFSDYHLVQHMTDSCKADIEKLSCGRIQNKASQEPHSQGLTIECLSKHTDQLEHNCKLQIFRLAELQSEDFHLDRALFFACRSEREEFCSKVRAGKGLVYKCLLKHKNERTMGHECSEQLSRRENLIVRDYQVSRGLMKACRNAIKENQCRKGAGREDSDFRLSKILLCLEGALRKGKIMDGECQEEVIAHRQMILEISPKIVENCKPEILELCSEARGPGRLHCLIKYFKKRNRDKISEQCQRALEDVIKVADPGEDWRIDPILYENCLPVVQNRCQGLKPGRGRVIRCLMRHMNSQFMTRNCETSLLEIQYFVARDWKLDPQLYQSCRNDSVKFCHVQNDWTESTSSQTADVSFLVLPCLFRYAYNPSPDRRLSQVCADDVRRVMHERAAYVQLHPQIELECMDSLASLCSENTSPGEEMLCLQKNYESLGKHCQNLVKNYTEAEAKDIGLNNLVMNHCSVIIEQVCNDLIQTDQIDEGAVMDCLIENKNIQLMREHYKCRAVVENFQIVMIKDFSFTPKFKQECHESVRQYCQHTQNRKEVLDCLSNKILSDILNEDRSSVSKACRQQVRKQLTLRHETPNLDPDLKRSCQTSIQEHCKTATGTGMVLECLRSHRSLLTPACHNIVFTREKEESVDPSTDVVLMKNCKQMFKTFCRDAEPNGMIACLMREKDNPDFDMKCRSVLMLRLVERSRDISLNPDLFRVCRIDARKYCSKDMNVNIPFERNGKVIECLKEQLPAKKLNHRCEMKIIEVTKISALNYKLDPVLVEKCGEDMKVLCPSQQEGSEKGEMEECLKLQLEQGKFANEQCRLHVAEIMQRERADIHADPILYQICKIDDTKYCSELPRGEHLKCMFDLLNRNPGALDSECRAKLRERREMFNAALKVAKLESVGDLVDSVRSSPQRTYFLVILFTVVGIVFLGGLTCGRASRRAHKLMKSR